MSWGNNNAGPVGVPPTGPNPLAGQIIGSGGGTATPLYNASIESVMAAVSRGEISLNQIVAANNQFGGVAGQAGSQLGNPTLLQAISQGQPQNGTNGLNGISAGGGTVNCSFASNNNSPGTFDGGVDSTATIDPRAMVSDVGVKFVSPIQYGGN